MSNRARRDRNAHTGVRVRAEGAEVILTGRDPVRLSQAAKEVGAVWVAHVAADLRLAVDRWREEFRALRFPFLIAGLDVSDPQVEEDRGRRTVERRQPTLDGQPR
jgi:hypothetical protein